MSFLQADYRFSVIPISIQADFCGNCDIGSSRKCRVLKITMAPRARVWKNDDEVSAGAYWVKSTQTC